ncbi:winged helix-turn-helix domain-containing protein [bacterium]|nr:winged helix-turn-helix domain-containing protein [bacterium]
MYAMDLTFLIPSKTRLKVLEYFVLNPDEKVHVNELARRLNLAPQLTYRELINMENWGFLFSSKSGNQRVYRVNKKFVYWEQIAELIEKRNQIKALQPPTISKVIDWDELSKEYRTIKIPATLDKNLKMKKNTPRAYTEEKMMKRKGLL